MKISVSYNLEGLCAQGDGMLLISDLNDYISKGQAADDPCGVGFELAQGVTDVEAGFFDLIPHLTHISAAPSVKNVGVTEKTKEIFAKNYTTVSGKFDTYAERFAKQNGLCFVHSDILLAQTGDYYERGRNIITLELFDNGTARLHQDCRCPGISAGNTGGGECDIRLPKDFYLTHSPKDLAELCWGSCYSEILKCQELRSFLAKAKKKHGFCFPNK